MPPVTTCACLHPAASHQTGDGPWTGFCYADPDCRCEAVSPLPSDACAWCGWSAFACEAITAAQGGVCCRDCIHPIPEKKA